MQQSVLHFLHPPPPPPRVIGGENDAGNTDAGSRCDSRTLLSATTASVAVEIKCLGDGGGGSIPFNKLPGGVRAEEEGGGAQQRPGFAEQWGRDEIGTRRGLLQAPGAIMLFMPAQAPPSARQQERVSEESGADGGDAPAKMRTS